MLSGQAQFEQAKYWRAVNLAVGVPASGLAAVAGATALASTTGRVAAGIIALVAAGLSGVATTLNAAQRHEQSQASGNLYLSLQSDARIARESDLAHLDFPDAREVLAGLRERQDDINHSSAAPARFAYHRAKRNVARGGQRYAVDAGTPEADDA